MPHVTLVDVESIMAQVKREDEEDEETAVLKQSTYNTYDTVEASVKYASYVERQAKEMESWRKARDVRIPPEIMYTYENCPPLSNGELEK